MNDVMQAVGVFFSYAVLAVFAQNAVFTRGLGGYHHGHLVSLIANRKKGKESPRHDRRNHVER